MQMAVNYYYWLFSTVFTEFMKNNVPVSFDWIMFNFTCLAFVCIRQEVFVLQSMANPNMHCPHAQCLRQNAHRPEIPTLN